MGTMPVPKLVLSMAAPMMLSMLVQALYNVVDSMFVSRIASTAAVPNMGDLAVNALTLVFPIQMLITAFCAGTGVGTNFNLARSLGKGDKERANQVAGNSKFLYIVYYIVIMLFGLLFAEKFISSQTKDPNIIEMGTAYLKIVTIGDIGGVGYMCYEKLMQATGKSTQTMIGQLVGAVTNIIFDPIFIFGYFGLPAMGIRGAAYATILGQFASWIVIMTFHFKINKEVTNGIKYIKPKLDIIRDIYKVGAPAILMQALTSVMTYGLNMILGAVSVSAVTAYGVYYKLQNFIFMPVFGLNNASVPIIAFNYGAKSKSRIKDTIKCGLIIGCTIMLIGTLLFQIVPRQILSMFSLSADAAELCVRAVRIITIGFVFAGTSVILQGVCQALGNGVFSLFISMTRTIIIVLPLTYALSRLANAEKMVWFAFPIAEVTACIVAVTLTIKIYRSRCREMQQK